jgi:dTDP-4-dehydrorhamnose reductase
MKRVLITGASGMVGYETCREAIDRGFVVTGLGRKDRHRLPGMKFACIDLTDTAAVSEVMHEVHPDLVVHLAANTNHAACEGDPASTWNLHVCATEHLANVSNKIGSRFIHVSTEAVYGNQGPGQRLETDPCHPTGVYATTKREAEVRVARAHPLATILRVTPVGFVPDVYGHTLAEWLLREFVNGKAVTGYEDVLFTPISSTSLAKLFFDPRLIAVCGTHNWGISETLSKYRFACDLAMALGFRNADIQAGKRFPNGEIHHAAMNSSVLAATLGAPTASASLLFEDLARTAPITFLKELQP